MFNIIIKIIIKFNNKFNNKINKKFSGFSLIELLVVITIIGVLSSIAVPAYFDYIVRTRIASEGLVVLDKLKKMVVEYYNASGRWPTVADLGVTGTTFNNTYINNISLITSTGTSTLQEIDIIVTFTDRVGASISSPGVDPALRLLSTSTPVVGGGGASNITWRCYSKNIIKRHLPTNCDNIP